MSPPRSLPHQDTDVPLSRHRPLLALALVAGLAACPGRRPSTVQPVQPAQPPAPPHALIPIPAAVRLTPSESFVLDSTTTVVVDAAAGPEVERIGQYLVQLIG